ncbi:tyrosine-type recombinase/integrase [Desulfovibrio falkowii]
MACGRVPNDDADVFTAHVIRAGFLADLCPCDHFCLHAIRHLTATLLAKDGVPMKDIQAILRHKRLATTENYIARMLPRENVLESVLVKTERLETQQRPEPQKSEVPHGSPHFESSSVKLQ